MNKLQLWAQYKDMPAASLLGKDDWTLVEEFDEVNALDLLIKKKELLKDSLVRDIFITKQVEIRIELT